MKFETCAVPAGQIYFSSASLMGSRNAFSCEMIQFQCSWPDPAHIWLPVSFSLVPIGKGPHAVRDWDIFIFLLNEIFHFFSPPSIADCSCDQSYRKSHRGDLLLKKKVSIIPTNQANICNFFKMYIYQVYNKWEYKSVSKLTELVVYRGGTSVR